MLLFTNKRVARISKFVMVGLEPTTHQMNESFTRDARGMGGRVHGRVKPGHPPGHDESRWERQITYTAHGRMFPCFFPDNVHALRRAHAKKRCGMRFGCTRPGGRFFPRPDPGPDTREMVRRDQNGNACKSRAL
jgi:hypothetical protein